MAAAQSLRERQPESGLARQGSLLAKGKAKCLGKAILQLPVTK